MMRLLDNLRYGAAAAVPSGVDVRRVERLFAPVFIPGRDFVERLEERIRAEPTVEIPALGRNWPRLAQAALLALVALGAVAMFWMATRSNGPKQVSADVLATAFANLESVDTLEYDVDAWISPGLCGTGFNVPADEEEMARLGVDRVILVTCGPDHYAEHGEYDPDGGPYGRGEYSVTATKLAGGLFVGDTSEIRRAGGATYLKDSLGMDWKTEGVALGLMNWNPLGWNPVAMMKGGTSFVGLGGLRSVIRDYTDAADLGEVQIDGVKVRHYLASKSIPGSNYSEEIEVWIGVADGLPRKATLKTYLPDSNWFDSMLERARGISDDPESEYFGDPVVTRAPAPDATSWALLYYTFSEFNQPLDIQAPTH